MPPRHEVTNIHKALNIYNIFLVKSLCPGVLVAKKNHQIKSDLPFSEYQTK